MPTYQYRCTQCGHDLEAVQKFSDVSLTECPNCGGQLRKIFNAVGVVFKGSGFYRNDSREKPAAESGSDTPATKTETTTKEPVGSTPTKADGGTSGSGESATTGAGTKESGAPGSGRSGGSDSGPNAKPSVGASTSSTSQKPAAR